MKIQGNPHLELEITICLTEAEARALDALACYGTDAFLEIFYKHMGRAYLEPYEKGLRSLLTSVRESPNGIQAILRRHNECRSVWDDTKVAVRKDQVRHGFKGDGQRCQYCGSPKSTHEGEQK